MMNNKKPQIHVVSETIRKQTVHIDVDVDFQPDSDVEVVEFIFTVPSMNHRSVRKTITMSADSFRLSQY